MKISARWRAALVSMAATVAMVPSASQAFDFSQSYSSGYSALNGNDVSQSVNSLTVTSTSGESNSTFITWLVPAGHYSFVFSTNVPDFAYLFYHDEPGPVHPRFWHFVNAGAVNFDLTVPGTFVLGADFYNVGEWVSLSNVPTGAPEIDGGKLPLAALLLGLVALIAQRKRIAALAG